MDSKYFLKQMTVLAFYGLLGASFSSSAQSTTSLATVKVRASEGDVTISADGVIEAIRSTVIAPQVSGAITQLPVQAGDSVKLGQLLVRLDARAAQQEFMASKAQVDLARANLAVAEKDYERQKLLFEKNYISQATLDRAQAQYKSAAAQANSQIAQATAVQTQSSFYTMSAPYNGVVAEMPSTVGDMAMPGRPIMTIYDPSSLRAIFTVPQAKVANLKLSSDLSLEIPSMPLGQRFISPKSVTVLPLSDANTHTVQVRLELPTNIKGVQPGMFARIALPLDGSKINQIGSAENRLYVPRSALFRRAEMYAVYVVNAQGKAVLRQVKPGPVSDTEQEILSGVAKDELVAINPLAASLSTAK